MGFDENFEPEDLEFRQVEDGENSFLEIQFGGTTIRLANISLEDLSEDRKQAILNSVQTIENIRLQNDSEIEVKGINIVERPAWMRDIDSIEAKRVKKMFREVVTKLGLNYNEESLLLAYIKTIEILKLIPYYPEKNVRIYETFASAILSQLELFILNLMDELILDEEEREIEKDDIIKQFATLGGKKGSAFIVGARQLSYLYSKFEFGFASFVSKYFDRYDLSNQTILEESVHRGSRSGFYLCIAIRNYYYNFEYPEVDLRSIFSKYKRLSSGKEQ